MGRGAGEEDFGEFFAEYFFAEIAHQDTIFADRDATGFFANYDGYGVGSLSEAYCRAVAQAG
jgi:hypothetical protein